MAYLFSKLNETIEGGAGARRASDVLQGGPAQPGGPGQGGPQGQGAPGIATQPSAVIGGGQGAPQPAAAGEAPTAVNSEARSKVFGKNAGAKLDGSVATGTIGSGIAQAQTNLQDEANKYVGAQQYQTFDTGKATAAVDSGDADGLSDVRNFLGGAASAAKDFSFDDSSLSGLRDRTRNLQSQDGLAAELLQQGGASYTQGEAGLDAAFLRSSAGFKKQRADLAQNFANLNAQREKAGVDTKAAVTQAAEKREADKLALRELLQKRGTGMVEADAQAGRAETAERQALNERAGKVREEMLAAFLKRPEFADAGFAGVTNRDQLRKIFEDPSLARFLTAGGGVGNYVSGTTAGRFNRINELLGLGSRLEASGSLEGRGGFDEAGYRAAVDGLLGKIKPNLAALRPPPPESEGRPVPVLGKAASGAAAIIDGIKSAGRAADPTNAGSRTNPVSGTANTVAKGAAVAAKVAPKPLKKPAKQAAKVAEKGAKVANKVAKKLDPRSW